MEKSKKILIINGSIRGMNGNSGQVAQRAMRRLSSTESVDATLLTLTDPMPAVEDVREILLRHDGFLVVSGVYWNNWGSPLQRFIEVVSSFENSPAFFGKPVACAVTMDSVGGIEVAGRIHAVFSGLGCWSPPCSTLVLSRIGQEAIHSSKHKEEDPNEDVWRLDDLEIILTNLIRSLSINGDWVQWPYVALSAERGPWPITGELNLGSPKFL